MRSHTIRRLFPFLLAFWRLELVAGCVNATDSEGTMYCIGLCTGVKCSIPLEAPCENVCWTGQEDCCEVIGANIILTNYQRNRLTYYDYWQDTHAVFAEDNEVSTQSNAQVAVIPGTSAVLLPVNDELRMFGRDGGFLGVFYKEPSASFTKLRFWNSTLFYLFDDMTAKLNRMEFDPIEGNVTQMGAIVAQEFINSIMRDLAMMPDGQLIMLVTTASDDAFVYKQTNDTNIELIVQVPKYYCPGARGLETFEDNTFAISCRNFPNNADAFTVRQGPRGLTYVSDFTGFNKPLVLYRGVLLGQLGSWGYLSSGMFLDFLHLEAYTGLSTAVGFPAISTAGVPFNVTVKIFNHNGGTVLQPANLALQVTGYMLMGSTDVVTLSTRETTVYETTQQPGTFIFTIPNDQATLAYSDSSGDMFIHPSAVDTSVDPEDFMFTGSVVVGPFHQVINQTKFYVSPGQMSPRNSYLTVPTEAAIVAGQQFSVLLYPSDASGNPIVTDFNASKITVAIDGRPVQPIDITSSYPLAIALSLSRAGPRLIYVYYHGQQVANPVTVVLQAGPAYALSSVASGPGVQSLVVGQNAFQIQPKDEFGNQLQYSIEAANLNYTVTLTLHPACYKLVQFEQYYDNDGLWRVSYVVEGVCDNSLQSALVSVTLNNVEIMREDSSGYYAQGPTSVYNLQIYKEEQLGEAAKATLIALGAIGFVVATIFHVLIYYWRDTNVMKFSQRRFLHVIMAGAMLSFCDVISRGVSATNVSCITSVWFYHLGFTVAFSALFVKAWRVTCIAHMTLRRMNISDHTLFQIILLCILCCCGYLVAWTLVDPPVEEDHETDAGPNHNNVVTTTVTDMCTSGRHVSWVLGITAAELIGLLYGSLLAYQNRDIHDAFAESKWTGIAIYNMMIQMMFVSAMMLLFKVQYSDYNASAIVNGIVIWLGTMSMICLIAIPKFYNILTKKEVTIHDFAQNISRSKNSGMVSGGNDTSLAPDYSTSNMSTRPHKENSHIHAVNPVLHVNVDSNYAGSF